MISIRLTLALWIAAIIMLADCSNQRRESIPVLHWYVFDEPSGAFSMVAGRCSEDSQQAYKIELVPLPADTDQQREQLVRRLAAGDTAIDIIGMDVIWTAEFAQAGWVLPWTGKAAEQAKAGRLDAPLQSTVYQNQLWAAPFTTNIQLLWYRTDRVSTPPATWEEMIRLAESLGETGTIQAQGERYEGLTVFFTSLLASIGGSVLDVSGKQISLAQQPTLQTLSMMARFANSSAADRALATAREDQARLAFESGNSSFMVNYTFVWPSVQKNAPEIAKHIGWARWPSMMEGQPSRFTIGGINLGVSAYTPHPQLAFHAAACLAAARHQRIAAELGGLPPTIAALYDEPEIRKTFPFADLLRSSLHDAAQRPQTPLYNDVSMAISRTLHPMRDIEPQKDSVRLRDAIMRALNSEGLL